MDGELTAGDKVATEFRSKEIGGMIANAASVFVGYGGKACMIDFLDTSSESDELIEALRSYKIDTTGINRQKEFQNSKCLILLRRDGERTILVVSSKCKDYVLNKTQEELLRNSGYLYSTIADIKKVRNLRTLLNEAILKNTKLVLDIESPSIEGADDMKIIEMASLIFMNQMALEKMKTLFGEKVLDDLRNKVPTVVVTKGSEGSEIYQSSGVYSIPSFPTKIVDTTGAGDTFNASFLFGLSRGWELKECGLFASVAASEKIARFGPRSGVRPLEEILKRLENEKQLNLKGVLE